jgi:hypothetical protein
MYIVKDIRIRSVPVVVVFISFESEVGIGSQNSEFRE